MTIRYMFKKMNIGDEFFFPYFETSVETMKRNMRKNNLNPDNYKFYIIKNEYKVRRIA